MKHLLWLLLLLPALVHAQALSPVNCAPAVPCSLSGPALTGTGMPLWQDFGIINANNSALNTVLAVPFANSNIPVPAYPETAAESSAGSTPVTYIYPQGNPLRYMTATQIADVMMSDASVDVSGAIQAALNVGGQVLVPCYVYRLASSVTIPPGTYVTSGDCGGSGIPTSYGATWQCDLAVTGACVTLGSASANNSSAGLTHLTVSRASGTPPSGSIGVLVQGLFDPVLAWVRSRNHSIGFEFLANVPGGLAAQVNNLNTSLISDAHIVQNTWPELKISSSRFGGESGDYSSCNTYVRIQGGSATSSTAGPNSLYLVNDQFDQNGSTCAYFLSFVNQTADAVSSLDDYVVADSHVETVGTAYIHSDSTWPLIDRVRISNSDFNTTGIDFFALNAATGVNRWQLSNNTIEGSFTLDPHSTGSISNVTMVGNLIFQTVTITGPDSSFDFSSVGDEWVGNGSLAGTFRNLIMASSVPVTSFTNTAAATRSLVAPNGNATLSGVVSAGAGFTTTSVPGLTCTYSTGGACVEATAASGHEARLEIAGNGNTVGTTSFQVRQTTANEAILGNLADAALRLETDGSDRVDVPATGGLAIDAPTSGVALQMPVTTVASLPSCTSSIKGAMYPVSDASSPTYGGTLTGGSSTYAIALCNGSAWVAH